MKSWLIQRANSYERKRLSPSDNRKGIDRIFLWDYMGSAEYEYGALSHSYERIKINLDKYELTKVFDTFEQYPVYLFCLRHKMKEIIEILKQGKNIALVSDAGTPGISDPG